MGIMDSLIRAVFFMAHLFSGVAKWHGELLWLAQGFDVIQRRDCHWYNEFMYDFGGAPAVADDALKRLGQRLSPA